MDPTVLNGFSAAFASLALGQAQQHDLAQRRQTDATQIDNRGLNAAVFKAITESDMGEIIANLNTASHAPTAQPFVVPNFISPAGTTIK